MKKLSDLSKLAVSIAISELVGGIGSLFSMPAIAGWYARLAKPEWTPPNWVFAPVWTTLFLLAGTSAFLVWRQGLNRKGVKIALAVFLAQLGLNALWSLIFFGLHAPGAAGIEIILLWLAILATMIAFGRISKAAAWLLVPYLVWVAFAGSLNASIWQLNQEQASVACTQEAKQCPDGSYVGRGGPRCEFAACPSQNADAWKTTTDPESGIAFQYPETLSTAYIHVVDWPPRLRLLDQVFECDEAGSETVRAGQIIDRLIGNRSYCVTKESEGAAGSTYTNYAYAFPEKDKTAIFIFSLRAVQCGNYDEPKKAECEAERARFDIDAVVDRMARSVKM